MNKVKPVADFLQNDRRVTCEEILQASGIPHTSVFRTFSRDLQKRKVCARWITHYLTAEQKQKSLDIAILLKERFDIEGQAFLFRIVPIDETLG